MITSTPQNRSAARLLLLVAEEHVETNPLFVSGNGLTHCNSFATRITTKMGVPLPLELANAQHAWLKAQTVPLTPIFGVRDPRFPLGSMPVGWEAAEAHTAQAMADQGCLAIASWANPIPEGHGHIGILVPSLGEPGVWVAAAGRQNFTRTLIQHSFGPIAPDYFVHP